MKKLLKKVFVGFIMVLLVTSSALITTNADQRVSDEQVTEVVERNTSYREMLKKNIWGFNEDLSARRFGVTDINGDGIEELMVCSFRQDLNWDYPGEIVEWENGAPRFVWTGTIVCSLYYSEKTGNVMLVEGSEPRKNAGYIVYQYDEFADEVWGDEERLMSVEITNGVYTSYEAGESIEISEDEFNARMQEYMPDKKLLDAPHTITQSNLDAYLPINEDVIRKKLETNLSKEVTTKQIELNVGDAWRVNTENIDALLSEAGYDYKSALPRIFFGEKVIMDTNYLTPACGVGVHNEKTQKILDFLYVADDEWADLLENYTNGTLAKKYGCKVLIAEEAEGNCYYARADKAGKTTITIPEYQLSSGETIKVNIPVEITVTVEKCQCIISDILYDGIGEKAPTCTTEGIGHKECKLCGDVLESNIKVAKLKHKLIKVNKVAATTKKKGMKAHYKCSGCSKLFSDANGKNEVAKSSLTIPVVKKAEAKGSIIKDKNGNKYKVTKSSVKNGTVIYVSPKSKKITSIKIADTVKVDGITYKITAISKNAFSGCTKLKKVTIGKNITTINCKAFYKCSALSSITINTKLLKAGNVGKDAFKGIKKNATIKVPKNKQKAYKTILLKKGVNKKANFKNI